MEKKQKLLIAILAVAGLGAGSFYYFTREEGPGAPTVLDAGAGRKTRAKTAEAPKTTARPAKTEKTAAAPAEPAGRKERVERTEDVSGRKTRSKTNTEVTKKKKPTPAA